MKFKSVYWTRQYRRFAFVAALFCGALLLAGRPFAAQAQYAPSPDGYQDQGTDNPSGRVGRLAYLQGNVSIEPNGVNDWSQAEPNYPVATGDRVYSDQSSRAEISVGSMVARMSAYTDVTMTNLNDQIVQMGLAQGTLRVRVYDVIPGNQIEVDTPNGAITLNQPGDFRIDVPPNDGATVLVVNQGSVEVSGPNLSENIGQGNAVELTGSNPVYLNAMAFPGYDGFDRWSEGRDRHLMNSRSAQYVSRDMPGFDDLDDYGSWQPDTEYGPVWYPNNVPADYIPYQTGHWIWVDPYGWTWVDNEPWGYAPFHYGRWAQVGARWGWVPGPVQVRPYWAPALVVFAGGGAGFGFGGGGGFAAWFPLGVAEPYVPSYHCSPAYVRNVNVTNINITVIHNTTIVNNYNTFVRTTNNFNNVRPVAVTYQNRQSGFTAVNGRAFTTGQPVRSNLAHVPPAAIQSATVIAHPNLIPTRQSLAPRPAPARVPVNVARPMLMTSAGKEQQAAPGARPVAVPYKPLPANQQRPQVGNAPVMEKPAPAPAPAPVAPARPATPPVQAERPQPMERPATPVASPAPVRPEPTPKPPTDQQRTLVNRSAPPVAAPTFQQQQPALKLDPGRSLGPVQKENLRQGLPAGRSPDVEALPHQPGKPAPKKER